MREPGPIVARRLVAAQFPEALAAWLGGSVFRGEATATSDLDITVLVAAGPAHRRSFSFADWPVEVFVHDPSSLRHFMGKDIERRQPSTQRLIGESEVLVDVDGSALRWQTEALATIEAGPAALSVRELEGARYGLTDLIDDLTGQPTGPAAAAIATLLWERTLQLFLTGARRWTGTGKGLVREVGEPLATRSVTALRGALDGYPEPLIAIADEVLAAHGGRLWDGYQQDAAESPVATST